MRDTGNGVAGHVRVIAAGRGPHGIDVRSWPLGPDTHVMRVRHHGIAVAARPPAPAGALDRRVSVAVLRSGDWRLDIDGRPVRPVPPPALAVVDQSRPFRFRSGSGGTIVAVHTRLSRLTLSPATLERAMPELTPRLPLYPLLISHIDHLAAAAAAATAILPELDAITLTLLRALLLSAADAEPPPDAAEPGDPILRYIHDNLGDPELAPATIAAALHISVRQLYKSWPAELGTPMRYIVGQRLERARATLVERPDLDIAAIARMHGFTRAARFAVRFREAYGVTPARFRREQVTGRARR